LTLNTAPKLVRASPELDISARLQFGVKIGMDRCTKSTLRTAVLFFLLTSSCFAASVSSRYTCLEGHEKEAIDKLQTFGNQAVLNFFKKKNIDVDSSTLQFMVNLTTETNYGGAPYVSFSGNVGGASSGAYTSSTSVGTIAPKTALNSMFFLAPDPTAKTRAIIESRLRKLALTGKETQLTATVVSSFSTQVTATLPRLCLS
jgi:hypothetical protein